MHEVGRLLDSLGSRFISYCGWLLCAAAVHGLARRLLPRFIEKFLTLTLNKEIRKVENMSFQKVLVQGPVGSITLEEAAGVAKLSAIGSADLGGGNMKGIVKVSNSTSIEIPAVHLMDAGLDLLGAKFPQFAAEVALVKAALDAEIAKL